MELIEKIEIDLMAGATEDKYKKKRAEYIADCEVYQSGGFLSMGHYRKDPALGEAKWNKMYPEGYDSWKAKQYELNAIGQQEIIDKVNQLIEVANRITAERSK